MKKILPLITSFTFYISNFSYSQIYYENQRLEAPDTVSAISFGFDVSVHDSFAIVGAPAGFNSSGIGSGTAFIFKSENGSWVELLKLCASDGDDDDAFGYSVDINGNYAIVGASWDDENGNGSGSAYIYKNNNGNWIEQVKLMSNDGIGYDQFGFSVSITDSFAVVGARGCDQNSGAVYVFKNNDGTWEQFSKHTAPGSEESYFFGFSTSIDNEHFIVGSLNNHAYVYEYSMNSWDLQQVLTAPYPTMHFGRQVDLSDTIIVASSMDSAYVFSKNGTVWSQEASLISSDESFEFGYDVSIHKNTAIVSAYKDDKGVAFVFNRSSGSWDQSAQLSIMSSINPDFWGFSVSNYNNTIILGTVYGGRSAFMYDSEDLNTSIIETNENKCLLYPNPISDGFHIKTEEYITYLCIYDMAGTLVKEYHHIGRGNAIPTIELTNGIYIVMVHTENSTYKKIMAIIKN